MRTVEVTQDDIDDGVKCDAQNCMTARAFGRAFPEFDYVMVSQHSTIGVIEGDVVYCPPTPDYVRQQINRFDRNETVEPFTFELPDYNGETAAQRTHLDDEMDEAMLVAAKAAVEQE